MNFLNKGNKCFFGILILFSFSHSYAQENFSILTEPAVSLTITTQGRWSYNFGVSNQEQLFKGDKLNFHGKYLELTHFTNYKISPHSKISLGLRQRFLNIYFPDLKDETSIMQQFGYSKKYTEVATSYRVRLEERFGQKTAFRSRYKFSLSFPLTEKEKVTTSSFVGYTEALWSFSSSTDPSFEQRIGSYFEKPVSKSSKINLGLEYRLSDYTRRTKNELFLVAALKITI